MPASLMTDTQLKKQRGSPIPWELLPKQIALAPLCTALLQHRSQLVKPPISYFQSKCLSKHRKALKTAAAGGIHF